MTSTDTTTFDYIIVGGGTAGLVVATRLAEDPDTTVCVIEAGEDRTDHPDLVVPGLAFKNLSNPDLDWGFSTIPQTGAKNRSIQVTRGKAVGGSSSINLMVLGRGHALEYDGFERLGAEGWNWNNLLEYFKKSETFTVTADEAAMFGTDLNVNVHGTTGPIQRTFPRWTSDIHMPFIETLKTLGVSSNPDCNGGDNTGMATSNHAIDPVNVSRSSSASAYYEPNKWRPNLQMIIGAHANRILLDANDSSSLLRAQGVEYTKDNQKHIILSRKEVLLCAGTFMTPKLLELSGIGKPDVLKSHSIPILLDLPGVGENLRSLMTRSGGRTSFNIVSQDHFWCSYTAKMDEKYESLDILANKDRSAREWKLYEESKSGMMSTLAASVFAFLPPKAFMSDESISRVSSAELDGKLYPKNVALQREWLAQNKVSFLEFASVSHFMSTSGKVAEPGKAYFSLLLALTHPFSRGTVHLSSADPLAPPLIDHQVLDNAIDLDILVESIKFARKVVATEPLSGMLTNEVAPGVGIQSDDELKNYVRDNIKTVFHPVGTASMLPREDNGVVDNELKVYGTANLRVIDASIIPIQVSCHIQATVYAIAEKAADIIQNQK